MGKRNKKAKSTASGEKAPAAEKFTDLGDKVKSSGKKQRIKDPAPTPRNGNFYYAALFIAVTSIVAIFLFPNLTRSVENTARPSYRVLTPVQEIDGMKEYSTFNEEDDQKSGVADDIKKDELTVESQQKADGEDQETDYEMSDQSQTESEVLHRHPESDDDIAIDKSVVQLQDDGLNSEHEQIDERENHNVEKAIEDQPLLTNNEEVVCGDVDDGSFEEETPGDKSLADDTMSIDQTDREDVSSVSTEKSDPKSMIDENFEDMKIEDVPKIDGNIELMQQDSEETIPSEQNHESAYNPDKDETEKNEKSPEIDEGSLTYDNLQKDFATEEDMEKDTNAPKEEIEELFDVNDNENQESSMTDRVDDEVVNQDSPQDDQDTSGSETLDEESSIDNTGVSNLDMNNNPTTGVTRELDQNNVDDSNDIEGNTKSDEHHENEAVVSSEKTHSVYEDDKVESTNDDDSNGTEENDFDEEEESEEEEEEEDAEDEDEDEEEEDDDESDMPTETEYLSPTTETRQYLDQSDDESTESVVEYSDISAGVKKQVLRKGTGEEIDAGDIITIHCVGYLDEDPPKKFWSTKDPSQRPFKFTVGKRQVIKGWDEGALSMTLHERSRIKIEPKKAYGKFGFEAWGIPPGASIILEMEVIEHKRMKSR